MKFRTEQLRFQPVALGGIGPSANYGYTHSSTTGVPLRTDTPALPRQAPNAGTSARRMIAGEFQPGLAFRTTMRTSSAMATTT